MSEYRNLLLRIDQELTDENIKSLKFACIDVLGAGRAERLTRATEIFLELERQDKLCDENRAYLANILGNIGRIDLKNMLLGIPGATSSASQGNAGAAVASGDAAAANVASQRTPNSISYHDIKVTEELINEIAEDVSIHWRLLGRKLGVKESLIQNIEHDNHTVEEKARQLLFTWQQRSQVKPTVQVLIDAMIGAGRRDLAEKVKETICPQVRENDGQLLDMSEIRANLPATREGEENTYYTNPVEEASRKVAPRAMPPRQVSDDTDTPVNARNPVEERSKHNSQLPLEERQSRHNEHRFPLAETSKHGTSEPLHLERPEERQISGDYADSPMDARNPVEERSKHNSKPVPLLEARNGISQPLHPERQEERQSSGQTPSTAPVYRGLPVAETKKIPSFNVAGNYLNPVKYEVLEQLGMGGYGKVYLCRKRETAEEMAVKIVDLGENNSETKEQTEALQREINLLNTLDSPYIVKYFGTTTEHDTLAMFIEYMPGRSIYQVISSRGPLHENTVRQYAWQILKGLSFLHSNNITHRDLKAANILLDKDGRRVKLTDFGISVKVEGIVTSTGANKSKDNVIASVYWTSPELLEAKSYGKNTDIWSLACTVVEMLYGKPPLKIDKLSYMQAMHKIATYEVNPPECCTPLTKQFVCLCLRKRKSRPSADELLATSVEDFTQTTGYPVVCEESGATLLFSTDSADIPDGSTAGS